jgi:hypothetical protein
MEHVSSWSVLMMLLYWEEIYMIKESAENLLNVSREVGLQVNPDKSKCKFNKYC